MKQEQQTRKNSKGFSLVELLISVVIVSGVLVGILSFYNSYLQGTLQNEIRSKSKFLAEQEAERLLSLNYSDIELDAFGGAGGDSQLFEDADYIFKTEVTFIDATTGTVPENYPSSDDDDTKLKRITVSVVRRDGMGGQVDLINFKTP